MYDLLGYILDMRYQMRWRVKASTAYNCIQPWLVLRRRVAFGGNCSIGHHLYHLLFKHCLYLTEVHKKPRKAYHAST